MALTRLLSVREYAPDCKRRKIWELASVMETFQTCGLLHPEAVLLGVGAGKEPLIFWLTERVKHVIATDLYSEPGMWKQHAPPDMLDNPGKYAPQNWSGRARLTVAHMDARNLRLANDSVDGVWSCSSIEHFGGWDDIAAAAREIGRVLKPGGVASLVTEFQVFGEGSGWEGVVLFDRQRLLDHIVRPSGLTLIDNPGLTLIADAETLATAWPLGDIVNRGLWPDIEGVLTNGLMAFTSVHLALRKDG